MSTHSIRIFGDPVLRTPTAKVETFDTDLERLVEDMIETMYAAPGVGLAANQIGVSLQVFVYDVGEGVGHVINPVLEISDEMQEGTEGCLSVPGLVHETPRAMHATVTGVDFRNQPVSISGSGLLARCFQHEVGHLNGKLYLDHLESKESKQAMKEVRNSEWFTAMPPMTSVAPSAFKYWYAHD